LPHREFEYYHPLFKMTKPEVYYMRLKQRNSPDLKEREERSIMHEENNAYPFELHEVTQEDIDKNPDLTSLCTKLYSYLNPELKLEEIRDLPNVPFDSSIQKLQPFSQNYTQIELNKVTEVDTRYIVSRFSPPMLKAFIDEALLKYPIYGAVVPKALYEDYQAVLDEVRRLCYTFFKGDGGFFNDYERSLYRKSLVDQSIAGQFADKRQPLAFTPSEIHFLEGVTNWPGSDNGSDTEFMYRPYFNSFDFIKEKYSMPESSFSKNLFRSYFVYRSINSNKLLANATATTLFKRVLIYLRCPEFSYNLDIPDSLIARNNLIGVHIWLLSSTLRRIASAVLNDMKDISVFARLTDVKARRKYNDYKKVFKITSLTSNNLKDHFLQMTDNCLTSLKISPVQRKKLEKLTENHAQQIQNLLRGHFEIDKKGREDLEIVVQEIFFPQYKDAVSFRPFVHQMTEYIFKHWEYLKTVSFDDFLYATIDWDVLRMDRELFREAIENSVRVEEEEEEPEADDVIYDTTKPQENAKGA